MSLLYLMVLDMFLNFTFLVADEVAPDDLLEEFFEELVLDAETVLISPLEYVVDPTVRVYPL